MLRPYQSALIAGITESWRSGNRNVIGVLPTGGGKSVILSAICGENRAPQIAIAHRQELVGQISLALARAGIYHRIIAPEHTIRFIVQQHIEELRNHFYQPHAETAVAGVDTLIRRTDELSTFLRRCSLWIVDEVHHLLSDNKWGRAVEACPNARGLGLTATPIRSDKRSLKRGLGGVFDAMVVGPSMRELIDAGYLCDYRIFAPPSDLNLAGVNTTASGEFNAGQLHAATERSRIVGDVVRSYERFAPGENGVTFAVDHALGEQHTAAFQAAGVPTALLTDKTPATARVEIMRAFRRRDLKMIVNQDIVGEGLDVPCITICIMARATASYGLFAQQFGRALRILPGKKHGILCDHVGNVKRHGLPDAEQNWTLDEGRPPLERLDELPVRSCPNPDCFRVFEGYSMTCPFCGFRPRAQPREQPALVEGDLEEFSPELLDQLRHEAKRTITVPRMRATSGRDHAVLAACHARSRAQLELREAMHYWAGVQRAAGLDDSTAYRKFYLRFGVDVLTAQTLGAPDAAKLLEMIRNATWHDYTRAA